MTWAAVSRYGGFDDTPSLSWANSYAAWIYLPVYPLLALAIATRRTPLAILLGCVAFVHVALVLPSFNSADPIPAAARTAPQITLVTANVRINNTRESELAAELAALQPDILFLQEVDDSWLASIRATSLGMELPYQIAGPHNAVGDGTAIFSRYPLRDAEVWMIENSRMTRATVDIGGVPIRLYNMHPVRPSKVSYRQWPEMLDALDREEGQIILAGDLNATQFNRWIMEVKHLGLRSAHERLGRGMATTWPNGMLTASSLPIPFPPIRLDHIFTTPNLVPLLIREGAGTGSDHKPVIARIAVVPLSTTVE